MTSKTIRVLLADDHGIVREGLRFLLESQPDITVVGEVENGREAVRQAKKLKPDLVVMDIAMPELNGIEATRLIRDATPETKVLILSIKHSREHVYRALEAGAGGYLLKESAGRNLFEAVRLVNLGKRYLGLGVIETVVEDFILHPKVDSAHDPLSTLSSRERQVLQMVAEGKSSTAIAQALFLSPKTVETYRSRLMQKLELHDITSLVKFAIQHGITGLE